MSAEKITIFDTTLRDGEQSPGCSMDTAEKLEVAKALVELEYYGQPVSWIEDYPIQIGAVTIDDVRRVARAHFSVDDLLFVVVANPDDVTDQLTRFGSVTQVSPK